ncbi:CinA family protein [Desertihabitans brevis]|uniref:CinA family protein n=1 Tax=Desertihabitans brevis TaxID=2268447 RepID=UPI001F40848F|nr:CinA family protein [Desertihabitans brevis]
MDAHEAVADPSRPDAVTRTVVGRLIARGGTVATAESLTAGLVSASLAEVPGASAVLRGGVVSYATEVKIGVLGVPEDVVAEHGVVSEPVATAMATGVQERLGADFGVATTGVAGPAPVDDHPPGHVWVAVAGPDGVSARLLQLDGDRNEVRDAAVVHALGLLLEQLD